MITLVPLIQGNIGWRLWGNWSPWSLSKAMFGPYWCLGLQFPWICVARTLEPWCDLKYCQHHYGASKEIMQGNVWSWLIPQAPVALNLLPNFIWDASIKGNYAGSEGDWMKWNILQRVWTNQQILRHISCFSENVPNVRTLQVPCVAQNQVVGDVPWAWSFEETVIGIYYRSKCNILACEFSRYFKLC